MRNRNGVRRCKTKSKTLFDNLENDSIVFILAHSVSLCCCCCFCSLLVPIFCPHNRLNHPFYLISERERNRDSTKYRTYLIQDWPRFNLNCLNTMHSHICEKKIFKIFALCHWSHNLWYVEVWRRFHWFAHDKFIDRDLKNNSTVAILNAVHEDHYCI